MYFYHLLIVILLSFICPLSAHAEENKGGNSLRHLLPSESLRPGWKLDATPETAEGIELYHLINGGAEIYMQTGFKRAILASYSDEKGKMINLEIFKIKCCSTWPAWWCNESNPFEAFHQNTDGISFTMCRYRDVFCVNAVPARATSAGSA